MQIDPQPRTRKSAAQSWDRRAKVAVGALVVMAAACITAGFVIGRMTAGSGGGYVIAHVERAGSGQLPTEAPGTPSVPFKKQPEPGAASGATAPTVVILNPGTADDPNSVPDTRHRDATGLRSEVRNSGDKRPPEHDRIGGGGDNRREAGSSTERDYPALREYMLRR